MESQNLNSWHDKTSLVILLCVIFLLVGLYALWKNPTISKGWKIAGTCFFTIIIIVNIGDIINDAINTTTATTAPKNGVVAPIVKETKPEVEILKQSLTDAAILNGYTIHCKVRNNTDELINYVDLKATFYDKQGNIIGTGLGNTINFAAGAEKTIDVKGMDIRNCDTYTVQVYNVMKENL